MPTIPPSAFPACDTEIFRLLGTRYKTLGREPDGLDCWGFVRRIYLAAGIALPDFPYTETATSQVAAFVKAGQGKLWLRLDRPSPYCLAVMGRKRIVSHVGIYHPDGVIFHSTADSGVCGQNLPTIKAIGFDLILFYQWQGEPPCPSSKSFPSPSSPISRPTTPSGQAPSPSKATRSGPASKISTPASPSLPKSPRS